MSPFWTVMIMVGPMFWALPVATLTFCVTWTVIALCGISHFNKLGHNLLVGSLMTMMFFTAKCLILVVKASSV